MTTALRETKIGRIPEDWDIVKLGDVCRKITDGTHKTPTYTAQGIPFLSTTNIMPFRKGFDFSQYCKYITRSEHLELTKRCKPEKGDLLISKCGTIGRSKLVDVDFEFSIFVGLALLKINNEIVSGEYLEQLLNYEPLQHELEIMAPGSTRQTLTINGINKVLIPLPSPPEQRKITEILSTVDEVIEKTDAIIQETQQLKKGLMQKLFVNRAFMVMRKAKEEETDLKLVAIHELGGIVTGTTPSTTVREYYNNPEYMFIGPADIGQSKRIVESANYISKEGFAVSRQLPYNAVMVVGIGATIGKVGITSEPCTTNQQINTIIPNIKEFPADYVYYLLVGISDYVSAFAGQTATPIMNKGEFGKMLTFIHPTFEERQRVADILSAIDSKIETEQSYKVELEQLKKGLMQVLLTGKVRVKV